MPAQENLLQPLGESLFRWIRWLRRKVVKIGEWTRVHVEIGWLRLRTWTGGREGAGKALVRLGELIRFRTKARESSAAYRTVDRLVSRHGPALLENCLDGEQPESLVLFVGYSRSGHSLVGSLLDAHPQAIISHELHAMQLFQQGATFEELVRYIKYNSFFFEYFGRGYTGYDYRVPDYYQGTYRDLKVAGDKKANRTSWILRKHPELLEKLIDESPVPVRFVHVIRNPLDNIATKTLRTENSLDKSVRRYFANAAYNERMKRQYPERVIDLYLDDLIARPEATLTELLEFLGLPAGPDYLRSCADLVADRPSRTRDRVDWDPGIERRILREMRDYPFLARYLETAS